MNFIFNEKIADDDNDKQNQTNNKNKIQFNIDSYVLVHLHFAT